MDKQKLLARKKLNGHHVGRAIIENLCSDYVREPGEPPMFTQAELDQLRSALATDRDIRVYNGYVHLQNALLTFQRISQGNLQQAQNGAYRLMTSVDAALTGEAFKALIRAQPVIVPHGMEVEEANAMLATDWETRRRLERCGMAVMATAHEVRPLTVEHVRAMVTSIDALAEDEAAGGIGSDMIRSARTVLLEPSMQEIYACNAFYEIIADVHDMPEVRAFQVDTFGVEVQVENVNQSAQRLLERIEDEADVAEANRATVRRLFPAIDLEALKPSDAAVEWTRRKVEDVTTFKRPSSEFLDALTGRKAVR